MATPYGGKRSKSFSTSQLRLGRTESLKEFAQVLQKQTTGRIKQSVEGIGKSAISSALAPLPGPLQASMYSMLTTNPFGGGGVGGETESTVEKISDDVEDLKNPAWAKNILRLFKEPLPVKIVTDRLGLLEAERERVIDVTPTAEKVDDTDIDENESKGFFASLLSGFKNLFFKGGLAKFLTTLMGGVGALAIGALKFAKGVGLIGLLATIIFNDRIIDILTDDFKKQAEKWNVSTTYAKFLHLLTGSEEGGLAMGLQNAGQWALVGGLAGWSAAGPPGIIAGAILGGSLGLITGILGSERIAQITNFMTDWWNKGLTNARLKWEEKELENLKEEEDSLEKQLKDAEKRGDDVTVIKLRDKLILINEQIRNTEASLYYLKLESLREEREALQERLKELIKQKDLFDKSANILSDKVKTSDFEKLFQQLQETKEVDYAVKDSKFGPPQMIKVESPGLNLSLDEFLKKSAEDQIKILEKLESDSKRIDDDQRLGIIRQLRPLLHQFRIQEDDTFNLDERKRQMITPLIRDMLMDPEMNAKLRIGMEKVFDKQINRLTPEIILDKLENTPQIMEKIFKTVYGQKSNEVQIILDSLNEKIIEHNSKEIPEPEDKKTSNVIPTNPADTLIPAIELSSSSVELLTNAFASGPGPANVISNSGNTSVVEGNKSNIEHTTFIQQFNTPSDYLNFA